MVAGARFATDLERLMVRSLEDAAQATRGALLNDVDHGTACRGCYLGREQACALHWGESKVGFIGCLALAYDGVSASNG
jgi:hypothetical protein